jgi:hypothetical protein
VTAGLDIRVCVVLTVSADDLERELARAAALDELGDVMPVDMPRQRRRIDAPHTETLQLIGSPGVDEELLVAEPWVAAVNDQFLEICNRLFHHHSSDIESGSLSLVGGHFRVSPRRLDVIEGSGHLSLPLAELSNRKLA